MKYILFTLVWVAIGYIGAKIGIWIALKLIK